ATAKQPQFVFVADGPNYPTALFGAAKVIEAAGRHAMGQDTEEWAHLQYFVSVESNTPTFVISPGGRGPGRAAELVEIMKRVGRTVIAVVPEGDTAVAGSADWVLPVIGDVPEIFSPMVYAVASELFAAQLSDVVGDPPFRRFSGAYQDGNTIQTSAVMESVTF
ncbi:MAG TPA: SIS domain-containing protein, partial [Roseiflexaceae bacterium]|nr:SIS domain-containing protein [Roseiflexaceae bacterium]